MRQSKPSTRGKEKKGDDDLELARGLAEASESQARDEDILAAIRKDLSAQLQEVITSNHRIKEAINTFSERLSGAESRISSAED